MSIKKCGVYLVYPSSSGIYDEQSEELVNLFRTMEKESREMVVACPSWSQKGLQQFFTRNNLSASNLELLSPPAKPLIFKLIQWSATIRKKLNPHRASLIAKTLSNKFFRIMNFFAVRLVTTRSYVVFTGLCLLFCLMAPLGLALGMVYFCYLIGQRILQRGDRQVKGFFLKNRKSPNSRNKNYIYEAVIHNEFEKILELVNHRDDIETWIYPLHSYIQVSRLKGNFTMLADSIFNSPLIQADQRYVSKLVDMQCNIKNARRLITSSERNRRRLMKQYGKQEEKISILQPYPLNLHQSIEVTGFVDNRAAILLLSRNLLKMIYYRNYSTEFPFHHQGDEMSFLFYNCRLKSNSNLMSLLKAYQYLLEKKRLNAKLLIYIHRVETKTMEYIQKHQLYQHVLWISDLSTQELAACYNLADLVIDPAFDAYNIQYLFIESLSFDTPMIVSNHYRNDFLISDIDSVSCFDPYDWEAMADKILWAMENREEVLAIQREIYQALLQQPSAVRKLRNIKKEALAVS
ncbi:hypothetical protein B1207_04565 [Legionella quinlivanii]|uniref:Glycosyl transferase family 1 domain-containing protein n=1 Tax=Legionella quinlivanii TaxID=45073 RepID=A0A364LL32_9GAMM|nr:glycosyltransferase [Legionella quinlivanii]RAP37451.1 hypothetical protein B1207_04565 [Legionella quinlivanii]